MLVDDRLSPGGELGQNGPCVPTTERSVKVFDGLNMVGHWFHLCMSIRTHGPTGFSFTREISNLIDSQIIHNPSAWSDPFAVNLRLRDYCLAEGLPDVLLFRVSDFVHAR